MTNVKSVPFYLWTLLFVCEVFKFRILSSRLLSTNYIDGFLLPSAYY